MKIRISNTAPFWKLLLLITWAFIVAACIVHSMSSFFKLSVLMHIGAGVLIPVYVVMITFVLTFSFFTTVFLAKGLLTWLDK